MQHTPACVYGCDSSSRASIIGGWPCRVLEAHAHTPWPRQLAAAAQQPNITRAGSRRFCRPRHDQSNPALVSPRVYTQYGRPSYQRTCARMACRTRRPSTSSRSNRSVRRRFHARWRAIHCRPPPNTRAPPHIDIHASQQPWCAQSRPSHARRTVDDCDRESTSMMGKARQRGGGCCGTWLGPGHCGSGVRVWSTHGTRARGHTASLHAQAAHRTDACSVAALKRHSSCGQACRCGSGGGWKAAC